MAKFLTPDHAGHFWAKLKIPTGEPEGEEWTSPDWEVVQVNDNYGEGDERWSVAVPGVPVPQWLPDFVWGPEVVRPDELRSRP